MINIIIIISPITHVDVRPLRQSGLLQPIIPKLSVKIGIGLQVLGCLAGSYAIPTMRKEFSYNELVGYGRDWGLRLQYIPKTLKKN